MKYATAVSKLRTVTAALDEVLRVAEASDAEVPIIAAYAFGAVLDGTDPIEHVDVAFVLARGVDELPWGVEPEEVATLLRRRRLDRFPLRWYCRPSDVPVTNHLIRRPVRLWTREDGADDAALHALTDRRFQDLARLPAPDPDALSRQLENEAAVCLRELDALVHRGGGVDPRAIAVELYDLAWGYTDLQRALGQVTPAPGEPRVVVAWTVDERDWLRAALRQGDGVAIVALLHDRPLDEVAQLAGDGLLLALAQGVPDADALAERCATCLRDRDWWGDEQLAAELDAARQGDVAVARRELPVDLGVLADELEGGGLGGFDEGMRLHVATGEFLPAVGDLEIMVGEPQPDDWEDPDAWLHVTPLGSRDGYRDMELFTATVTDRALAGRLERALTGRGVFRRFRDVLEQDPHEWDRWRVFSDERTRARARAWLADQGYRPAVAPER